MLEQHRVSRGHLRGRDADDLVVGEVPRLDGEQHTERLVHELHVLTAEALRRQVARLQELGALVDVVLEDLRRQLDLGLRLGDELAHLEREDLGVAALVCAQQPGGLAEHGRALLGARVPPLLEGRVGPFDGGVDLLRRRVVEGPHDLSGVRIRGCVGHESSIPVVVRLPGCRDAAADGRRGVRARPSSTGPERTPTAGAILPRHPLQRSCT
nr:hypothetical protein [Pseudoclavibacter chungangensis]